VVKKRLLAFSWFFPRALRAFVQGMAVSGCYRLFGVCCPS